MAQSEYQNLRRSRHLSQSNRVVSLKRCCLQVSIRDELYQTSPNIFAHATWSAGGLQDLMPNHPMVIGSSVKDIEPFDDVSLMAYCLEDGEPVFEVD